MGLRYTLLYWIVLGFAGGVVVSELTHGESVFLIVGAVVAIALVAAATAAVGLASRVPIVFIFVIFCAVLGGFFRNYWAQAAAARPTPLDQFVTEKISLTGVLVDEQERRDFNTRLTVRVREIESGGIKGEASGEKILVTTGNPKDFRYGDVVRVKGQLTRPENFYTDTGREFDYIGYLQASDVRFLIKNASVTVLGREPPSKILAWLFSAKRAFVGSLARLLPEPQSSLAAGILIDGKQSINGELQEKFRKTGLVHIVVLSGYNVSIVAEAIGKTLSLLPLPRVVGLGSASVGIVAFALITGASATVVRASIMAILVLLSRFYLRNYDPARGLFIASGLMLTHNPTILLHSPSFQLSFLATFAVVKVIPMLEALGASPNAVPGLGVLAFVMRLTRFIPERFGLRELVVSNVLVQAFLFPILTWMTGFFSAVSLPVNLLVLPLIPTTMLACFLAGMAGVFGQASSVIALPFAFVSQTLLSYELIVVNFFAKFSLAEIPFGGFSGWFVAGFYVAAILVLVMRG